MAIDWESFTDHTLEAAEVRLLGYVELPAVLALQKLMVHEVRRQTQLSAGVMICEHPPTLTVGRDGTLLDLPADKREIESRSLQIHRVPRTGGTIFHQPGQLAIYVVMSLEERDFTKQIFQRQLAQAVVAACRDSHVSAFTKDEDFTSVYGRHGLIAELGICLEDGVTSFGAVLNVSNRLDEARYFGRGLHGTRLSSLSAERVRPTIMARIRSSLIEQLCEHIGYPEYHIHTGHPFLKRVRSASGTP